MNTPANNDDLDEFPPDLDFESLKGGVRGKYVDRFREDTNVILLAPDHPTATP